MIDFSKMSGQHISQISHLQQAIWDLEKARSNIVCAMGNSESGKVYMSDVTGLIELIEDNIDKIHEEYKLPK